MGEPARPNSRQFALPVDSAPRACFSWFRIMNVVRICEQPLQRRSGAPMMSLVHTSRSARWTTVLAASIAVLIGGCSSSNSGSSGGSSTNSAPLFSALPEAIQQSGTITVGSSIDYPPFESYAADGKTLQGFEPELAVELEKKLGVKFQWNNANFDTLFSALRGNRYNIVYGAVNDTAEREKTFDFVDYLQSSQAFVVGKGNPQGIKTVDDLCGKAVAAVRGGVQEQFLHG